MAARFLEPAALGALLDELVERGYQLIGPTVRDGAIVMDRIDGLADLPRGVGAEEGPGTHRLVARDDERLFGFAHGPDAAKRFLFPPREHLATATKRDGTLAIDPATPEATRFAFVGMRACDLHAVAIQDRVFLNGPAPDVLYASRREGAFFLAVNCTEPGGTCFCASIGTGPTCTAGFDIALTELDDGFVAEAGTGLGRELLLAVGARPATEAQRNEATAAAEGAVDRMGRDVDLSDLPGLLYRNRRHPRWTEVGDRCLACGNCTAVCPTCFCHDVVDATDLAGTTAERTREWASCFSVEFSHTVGEDVRSSRPARYRQWLTHKFGSWIDQFGTSGCVGCGRCITWCPVGIDVTEELAAIRASDGAGRLEAVAG